MLQQSMAELRGPSVLDEFPGTAPKAEVDQIQVMEPEKTSHTVIVKGQVTGVGRKGDNQIVLEDPKVSRYHLRIEQVGTAYQVTDLGSANGTFLSGVRLLKGVPQAWAPEQPLQVGDTYLKLVRAREVAGTQVDIGRISVPQKEESRFAVTLDKAQSSVEPGSSDTFSVKIRNQASQVDHYQLSVEGVPGDWVKNLPGQPLRCMPGEEQMVSLVIQPPRAPQSRAGRYPLAVVVTSQEDPSQVMRSTSTLTVTPYRLFSGQLYPERVRAGKSSWVRMANQGNMPETFEITWSDQANELVFEPSQARIKVEEGKSAEMEFRGRLRQRRWMGGEKSHRFSTQVNMLNGQPQMVPGEFISKGLIPPWLLPLVMMLCVLLLAGAGAFYGMVIQPQAQKTQSAGTAIAQAAITASVAAEQNRDVDGDGLSNIREYEYATDSNNPDTDGDGLTDGEEVDRYDTKPKNPDSDGDSWLDGREVKEEGTSPNNRDTDGDNLQDNVDPDPGHLPTSTPIPTHTPTSTPSPIFTITLPPTQSPPDINFTDDDGDGLTYGEEKALGTNPGKADTDGDNLSDYKEVKEYKTDPTDVDTDSDGMNDNNEIERGTNPNKRPRIMYDFVTKANKAVWMSGVGDRLVLNTLVIPWTSVKAGSQLTLSPDPNIAQGIIDFGGPYNNPKGSAMLRNNLELEDGKTYPSFLWTHPRYVDDGYIMGFFTDILNSGYVVGAEDDFVLTVGFQKGAASGNVRFIVLIRTESGMNITLNPIQKSYDEKLRSNRFPLKAWEGQKVDFVLRVEANGPSKQDWSIWLKARIERNE
jgi:pSer/pThr/pTyr-binding forkhead associated (FHA) protein